MAENSQSEDDAGAPALPGTMHRDQLAGQIRDFILGHVQSMRTSWAALPAAEQKAYIDNASKDAVQFVDMCLDCILVDGDGVVVDATANDVTFKKESIQTRINIQYGAENTDLLKSAAHKPIKLVFAPQRDKVRSLGESPKADADQPEMFEDEDETIRTQAPAKSVKVDDDALKTKGKVRRRAKAISVVK